MLLRGTRTPIVGASAAFLALLEKMERVASTDATVLVSGETGTGKELVARAIHDRSQRQPGPFIPVDCATLTDELFDSELFGHTRDAFTGAQRERRGRVALAEGGTLFFDGIDSLNRSCQGRLLRTIQEKEILPLGRTRAEPVSFRLVSSVTPEFDDHLQDGTFRRDLYFRLNVVHLRLPPLRERRDDIAVLSRYFLVTTSKRMGKALCRIDRKALDVMRAYNWPGNVRELAGVIECAVASARGEVLYESDLPVYVRIARAAEPESAPTTSAEPSADLAETGRQKSGTFHEQVTEFQRRLLVAALSRHSWSYQAAGQELGLARHQVKYLCAKLGVRRSRFETRE